MDVRALGHKSPQIEGDFGQLVISFLHPEMTISVAARAILVEQEEGE
jgi:hypothetical protein